MRDDGIGIAPDMLPHVFELFVQAEHASTKAQGGLGIGLYICKRLIELHGGSISAYSEGAGRGATFRLQLPLLHEAALVAPSPADIAKEVAPVAGGSKRILVVDDNVDSAITLSWLLSQHGYVVETAHDGKSGLDVAHAFKPDIVLLDIGLPGINGYDLAKRLRAEGFSSAALVAISGYALEADIERSRAAGFDRHMAKPVDIEHLVRALAEL